MKRELTASDVIFALTVEPEYIPVRGNAVVSGNEDEDRAVEDAIIERLVNGDVWAWATVRVRATYRGFHGDAFLGGCSYDSEKDFADSGELETLRQEALDALNEAIDNAEAVVRSVREKK